MKYNWPRAARLLAGPRLIYILFLVYALFDVTQTLLWVGAEPYIGNDSAGYIYFQDFRPHGYSFLLAIHDRIFGSLRHLPQIQALLYLLSLVYLSLVIAWRERLPILAAPIYIVGAMYAPGLDYWGVMSDTLYAASLLAGIASLLVFFYRSWTVPLLAASFFLGLAAATRTIGIVPAGLCGILVFAVALRRRETNWRKLALIAVAPGLAILTAAATSNYVHNASFRIGSFGGVSLLGKGLVLASPLPETEELSSLNWVAEATQPAGDAVQNIDDVMIKMMVVRQYYEYLRWFLTWEQFQARWLSWQQASPYEMGQLAGELAKAYIERDFRFYLDLVLLDYASLWLTPRIYTEAERVELSQRLLSTGDLPYLTEFGRSEMGKNDYFSILPSSVSPDRVWVIRFVSLGFFIVSLTFLVALLASRGRVRLFWVHLDLILLCLIPHACYAATAVSEAGLERYIFPTWALVAGALPLLVIRLGPIVSERLGQR